MKRCSVEGCNSPVWSKGMCKQHIPKTPLKNKANMLAVERFKSFPSPTKSVIQQIEQAFLGTQKRDRFFMNIWIDRDHKCAVCGISLGHNPHSYNFDHLLEKSKYPDLEFEEDNIALVCLKCHDKKTRGFINEKYQELINFVITKYNIS